MADYSLQLLIQNLSPTFSTAPPPTKGKKKKTDKGKGEGKEYYPNFNQN